MNQLKSRRAVLTDFMSNDSLLTNSNIFQDKNESQDKIKSFKIQGNYGATKFIKP
jgi:hypothetical protein